MPVALGSDQRISASRSLDTLTRHRFLPTKAAVIELIVLFGVILVVTVFQNTIMGRRVFYG